MRNRVIGYLMCVVLLIAGVARFTAARCASADCRTAASHACCCGVSSECSCSEKAPSDPQPSPAPAQEPRTEIAQIPGEDAGTVLVAATDRGDNRPPRISATVLPATPGRSRQIVLSTFRL